MSDPQDKLCTAIEHLVSQKTGIDLAIISGIDVANVIQRLLGTLQIAKLEAYYHSLLEDPATFSKLIESLVIPETSFFRHPAAFDFLKTYCLQQRHQKKIFRILSVPCSTGEEPYSMAIALLEAGFLPQQISIDAFDISQDALDKAKQGIYKKYAFRSVDAEYDQYYLQKYFDQQNNLYFIKQEVKDIINFQIGNLVEPNFLLTPHLYDVIFCRNVLIYFNQTARRFVLKKLHRALVDQGLLFIGYAETNFIDNHDFQVLSIPHAFTYAKKSYQLSLEQTLNQLTFPKLSPTPLKKTDLPTALSRSSYRLRTLPSRHIFPLPLSSFKNKTPSTNSSQQQGDRRTNKKIVNVSKNSLQGLENIRQLADQNQLDLALEQCQEFIQENPTEAQAYLLLGEIYQAKNQDLSAKITYKKALYLNSKCEETITHLILLSEQLQEFSQAERYRERLKSLHASE
jgi:chemotaxis protein methyltransferase WspC